MLEFNQNNKIFILVEGLDSGGIENYLLRFLRFSHSEFDKIIIVCKSGRTGVLESDFLEIPNVEIVKFKLQVFDFLQYFKFRNLLLKQIPSCIVDFTGHFGAIPVFIARTASIQNRIVFYRSSTDRFKRTFLRRVVVNFCKFLIRKHANKILANSESAFLNYYPEYYKNDDRYKVIYNGVDFKEFESVSNNLKNELGIKVDDFIIGHIGRLNEAKNHKTILNVAISLCQKYPHVKFVCCGLNVETLSPLVPKALQERIILLPFRRDVKNVLHLMDCFYFPSITEGNPNALIEAMLFNIPIVASNIEPIKECMPIDAHSDLVEPFDESTACERLELFIEGRSAPVDYKQWALEKFDYQKLFNEFLYTIKQ